jgi:hypothetical protein
MRGAVVVLLVAGPGSAFGAKDRPLAPLVRLLATTDDAGVQRDVLRGMWEALRGRRAVREPEGWPAVYRKLSASKDAEVRELATALAVLFGDPQALEVLRQKRGGKYTVLQVDPAYAPPPVERREVFGVTFEQRRNDVVPGPEHLQNVVTQRRELSDEVRRDMLVALVALKYTQSNSVGLVLDGQVIGMGAGQQSRIHCTRLAASKAETWYLRHHPSVLSLRFKPGLDRVERDNAIDQYLRDDLTPAELELWQDCFEAA